MHEHFTMKVQKFKPSCINGKVSFNELKFLKGTYSLY